ERPKQQRALLTLALVALCGVLLLGLAAWDESSSPLVARVTSTPTSALSPTGTLPTATLTPAPTSTPVSHVLSVVFSVRIDVVDCTSAQPVGTLCINVSGGGASSVFGALSVSHSAVLSPPGDDSYGPSTSTGKLTTASGDTATFKATSQCCRSTPTARYTYTITGGQATISMRLVWAVWRYRV
ncbi:MAG TPA: hypothetical protein VGP82_17845, partial [Ktedonobacterales bacterium]|nr:hypothetical protein [Ktedonobacterales bacterium]